MPANALLLQGPVGPFFKRLAKQLEQQGLHVYKINLNGGDAFFYRGQAIAFRGPIAHWPQFFEQQLKTLAIDRLYLFGACRPYHAMARAIAKKRGVRVFVFDEGYLRPDCITLEEVAPNGASLVPQDPAFYRGFTAQEPVALRAVGKTFGMMAWYASWYYFAGCLASWRYPHYQHHRPLNLLGEGYRWIRSGLRLVGYRVAEQRSLTQVTTDWSGRYFLVPLQVHCDAQVLHRSPFASVAQFIETVVISFAHHAPNETALVIKHHPMDRGYRDYTKLIKTLASHHHVTERVLYVHDLHLPTLLKHARGTVVINSTVGLSSLHHGTPVKALGEAPYDLPGLTCQSALEEFWGAPGPVDRALYRRFRAYLLATSQLNGNFYRRLAKIGNPMGVVWPSAIQVTASRSASKRPPQNRQPISSGFQEAGYGSSVSEATGYVVGKQIS